MPIEAVKHLPKTISKHYIHQNVPADNISGIWNGRPDGVQTYEIEFDDGTTDIWEWTKNPASQDQKFPNTWMLVEEGVPSEDDEDDSEEEEEESSHQRRLQTA